MILQCNYEELRALSSGAELLLSGRSDAREGGIAAPATADAEVKMLQPRLTGSLSIHSLAEQRSVRSAVSTICDALHQRMEATVVEFHPGHEDAVNLYFDYAHVLSVLSRLDEMGAEMTALVEVMTGGPVDEASAASVTFPD